MPNYDSDMEMIGRELAVCGGDAASGSLERMVGQLVEVRAQLEALEQVAYMDTAIEPWQSYVGAINRLDVVIERLQRILPNNKVSHHSDNAGGARGKDTNDK